jgi:4-amino-4-deoxy-L-arabinose transferase-like glycosyltransferase
MLNIGRAWKVKSRPASHFLLSAFLFCLGFLWVELAAIPLEAPTADEQNHLARGLSVLRTGDLRLQIGHPPLINVWAAFPLAVDARIQLPLESETWRTARWIEFAIDVLWKLDNPASQMFYAARVMMVLLGALTLAVLYRLGAEVGGRWLGFLMLATAVLDPNFRAHARLVTTDLGALFGLALITLTWRRILRHSSPATSQLVLAGLALGLALASKFTALFFVPPVFLCAFVVWGWRWKTIARLSVIGLVAFLGVWAAHGFEFRPVVGVGWPLPAATYVEELLAATTVTRLPIYFMGRLAPSFYEYFPVIFAAKTPLAVIGLLVIGIFVYLRKTPITNPPITLPPISNSLILFLPPVFYFFMVIIGGVNIGYRHILPILPMAYLLAALGFKALWQTSRRTQWVAAALGAWLIFTNALIYPRDLTYFNEIAGGPENGWRISVDSNLDWGQDLGALAAFVRERNIPEIYTSYFGAVPIGSFPVRQFSIPAIPLPPRPNPAWHPLSPAPGWYAISVTHLWGGASLQNPDEFAYFRHRAPKAILGRTIYIYNVPAQTGTLAVCNGLNPSELRKQFNAERELTFDCARGLPLSTGLTWYVLNGNQAAELQATLVRLGAALQFAPAYEPNPERAIYVYRLENASAQAEKLIAGPPVRANFGGLLEFLGADYAQSLTPNPAVPIHTVWRVLAPLPEPASIFLHLAAEDGFPLAVSDGLNTPFGVLQPGDALIQRHWIEVPENWPPGAHFRVGLYALGGAQIRYLLPTGADYFEFGH